MHKIRWVDVCVKIFLTVRAMAMIRCALESPDPRLSSAQPTSTQKHLLADVPDLKVAGNSAILATGAIISRIFRFLLGAFLVPN